MTMLLGNRGIWEMASWLHRLPFLTLPPGKTRELDVLRPRRWKNFCHFHLRPADWSQHWVWITVEAATWAANVGRVVQKTHNCL